MLESKESCHVHILALNTAQLCYHSRVDPTMCRDADNRANTAAAGEDGGEQAGHMPAAKKAGSGRKRAKETVEQAQPITKFFIK